jgi:colanic acid/amylovoran biosynthesis glycosyltransferase
MKKLIFKIGQFPHLSETFILAQIITAIKCGYEVKILVSELLDFESSKQLELIEKYDIEKKIILENYNIPSNKALRLLKWIVLLILNLKNIKRIIQFYKGNIKFSLTWLYKWVFYNQFNEVAIFHVQYGTNSSTLALLKKIGFNPSVIVTFHGHDAFFPINGSIPNNGYYDNLFKFGNLITANTPYLADKIRELGCPKELISIVPVGVDTDFFYPIKKGLCKNEKSKLISVGRLSVVKGHIYAFEVVKKLKEASYDIVLTVVGEGSERLNLENYIKDNKLNESIVLVGAKSREEIRELLQDNDIFLFPSVSLHYGISTETQGLANNEAMACGLPVVVFDSGGVKYTLEDGISGFVCEEYDIDCMISKVKILIEDTEMAKIMSDQAVTFVNKNYSQKVINSKWEKIYNNLSNGK